MVAISEFKLQVSEMVQSIRERGIKKSLRRYGWRMLAIVFVYYLIRDSLIYLIIPFAIRMLL